MKITVSILCLFFSIHSQAKEWKSLKAFQRATQRTELSSKDWLSSDRRKNTATWQNANTYNLTNNLSQEYKTIKQRRDFYKWFTIQIKQKGHEVVWPSMAYYISRKLRLTKVFPVNILAKRQVKEYASQGSEVVFNNSFIDLNELFLSNKILKGNDALDWDKNILNKEQYIWLDGIYKTIDSKGLKQIENIAEGKCIYGLFLPKAIRFKGDISNAEDRYIFALEKLRVYCENSINFGVNKA